MARHFKHFLDSIIPKQHAWKIKLFQAWNSIIGDLAQHVRIETIQGSILVLGVSHPVWAQELHLLSDILKAKINAAIGEECITTLRFKVVYSSRNASKKEKQYTAPSSKQKPKNVSLSSQELLTLKQIKDSELRKVLQDYCRLLKDTTKTEY